jgi:hypothetical protein
VKSYDGTNNKTDSIDNWFKEFVLPYNKGADSNSLIFYYTQSFDTTFLVQINNERQFARCVYYRISPQNKMQVKGIRNQQNDLTSFEGLSRKIDTATWRQIVDEISRLKFDPDKTNETGCCDIPFYFLSYNGSVYRSNNKHNESQLKVVKGLLKSLLLNELDSIHVSK